ncbi:hypothetical protein [Leisingera sp. MMG026]|uniref:hypothetical protein n=1 Tax=Leisingera sp. MMG026 TaxID=2909982 RepID=UPI001F47EAE1|nr:hypothetical protein [Leisingera sp. MMG026]MCF6432642.1 hypothetical protein [Leisingera sp. MMG026]
MLDHKTISETLFENDIRMDCITWLAGATEGFTNDEFFTDAIFDALNDFVWVHDSMKIFNDAPECHDEIDFLEWTINHGLFGFILRVRTPKPTKFCADGSYHSASWGYTAGTAIYVTDLAEAMPMAIAWRDAQMADWRNAEAAA